MIEIKQNFLETSDLDLVQRTLKEERWGFGYISNDVEKPIWNFDKTSGKPVASIIASKFSPLTMIDWHINGQTFQQSGSIHNDSANGCTTALVFFPHEWNFDWGGRLHIFTDNGVMSITPEKNLCVVFDSRYPHYAEAPVVNKLRVSIGVKLK